jgi:transposase
MSMPRTADAAGYVRRLAVARVKAGYTQVSVARILGVGQRTLRRWVFQDRRGGEAALASRAPGGRPPKLDGRKTAAVLGWLGRSPREFGFVTERWTAPRVAELIRREWGVSMNHRYLNSWLARHGVTPQIPARQAQERDEQGIIRWVRYVWPHIKKGP